MHLLVLKHSTTMHIIIAKMRKQRCLSVTNYVLSITVGIGLILTKFFSAHVSTEIFLVHNYPLLGNFSQVELYCKADYFYPRLFDFFLGETKITPQTAIGYRGVLSYTITPEREGPLTCRSRDGKEKSNVLKLAGN